MSHSLNDRWLWLGFGAFLFFAVKGIRYAFEDITEMTVLAPLESNDGHAEDNAPETAIDYHTLKTLATSPNCNISNMAIAIVMERVLKECNLRNDGEWLFEDLDSSDPERRRNARVARDYLQGYLRMMGPWGANVRSSVSGHFGINTDDGRSTPMSIPELTDARDELSQVEHLLHNPDGWTSIPRARRPSLNDEAEAQRRRRRRHAIVYYDGNGAVEGDIFDF